MNSEGKADASGTALSIWLERCAQVYSGSTVVFWPITDAVMRFFVALGYFRSGMVKAENWDKALFLAAEVYPVSWMSAQNAAATGLAIELVAPVLLLFGFFTRPAALALALLTIVAQAVYIPTTTNLMLIAMLIWFVVAGPAAISLDAIWATKARKAGLRVLAALVQFGRSLRFHLAPFVVLAMRLWLGVALLAYAELFEPSIALATWLPITSFSGMPHWLAILFALLLITGTAASPVSYALTFIIAAFMLAGAHPDVTFYPVLLLGVYEARGAGPFSIDNAVGHWLAAKFALGEEEGPCPDDPETWLATLKSWWAGGRSFAGKVWAKRRNHA